MCSTIRPRPRARCFSFLQTRHFWKAPTSSFHHNFILAYLLAAALRFGGPKCA